MLCDWNTTKTPNVMVTIPTTLILGPPKVYAMALVRAGLRCLVFFLFP